MIKFMSCRGCGGGSLSQHCPFLWLRIFPLLNYYATATLDCKVTVLTELDTKFKLIYMMPFTLSKKGLNIFDNTLYLE